MALAQKQLPSEEDSDDDFKTSAKSASTGAIPLQLKEFWISKLCWPLEKLLVVSKLSPNQITFLGTALSLTSIVIIASGYLITGALALFVACSFDFMDGRIARRLNLASKSGSFLDSVMDRYVDFALLAAFGVLLYGQAAMFLVLLALLGTSTTPYIRAKSEAMGLECQSGLMQRPERIICLGLSLLLQGVAVNYFAVVNSWFLIAGVTTVAIFSNISSIERGFRSFKRLQDIDKLKKKSPL